MEGETGWSSPDARRDVGFAGGAISLLTPDSSRMRPPNRGGFSPVIDFNDPHRVPDLARIGAGRGVDSVHLRAVEDRRYLAIYDGGQGTPLGDGRRGVLGSQ